MQNKIVIIISFFILLVGANIINANQNNEYNILGTPKIWDASPHNAFTSLVRHNDKWYCVFREGTSHLSLDGGIRIITSNDGSSWKSLAFIALEKYDLRDPKIVVTPKNELMLTAIGKNKLNKTYTSYVWFSVDGANWTNQISVIDPNYWLWRVTWHKGICYAVAYESGEIGTVRLYKSIDGKKFDVIVPTIYGIGRPNESSIVFLKDDTAVCLLRRDPGNALLGVSKPPYNSWKWFDSGLRVGGPQLILLPDGRLFAGVRLSVGRHRTSLCIVDQNKWSLKEVLTLPSGGDNSYPGLVWFDNLLWMSYHSTYYDKISIYMAKIKLPEI